MHWYNMYVNRNSPTLFLRSMILASCWHIYPFSCISIRFFSCQSVTKVSFCNVLVRQNVKRNWPTIFSNPSFLHPAIIKIFTCAFIISIRLFLYKYVATHGRDQTKTIWILRSISFPDRSFEWRELHLFTEKHVWNIRDSRENVFDMYGDFRENWLDIWSVVIIFSPISSIRGIGLFSCTSPPDPINHVCSLTGK